MGTQINNVSSDSPDSLFDDKTGLSFYLCELSYTKRTLVMSWIQTMLTTYLVVNLTILLSVVTVIIYHRAIWPLSSVDAADGDSLFTRDGVQMDHWTSHWGQERWNTVGPQWSPTTTNPQGCSITRTSIALPLITKPHLRAKLANTLCKLCLWLHYLIKYLAFTCPLVVIASFIATVRQKLSVSNFTVTLQS